MPVSDQTNYRSAVREVIIEAIQGTGYTIVRDFSEETPYALPFANIVLLPISVSSTQKYENGSGVRSTAIAIPFRIYGRYDAAAQGASLDAGGAILETLEQHLINAEGVEFESSAAYVRIESIQINATACDIERTEQTVNEYVLLGEASCTVHYKPVP